MSNFTSDDGDDGWSQEYTNFNRRYTTSIKFEDISPELGELLFGVDYTEPPLEEQLRRKFLFTYANGGSVEFDAEIDHVSPIDRVDDCLSYSFTMNHINNVVYKNVQQLVTPPEPTPYWCSWRGLLWDEPIRRAREWWGNRGC